MTPLPQYLTDSPEYSTSWEIANETSFRVQVYKWNVYSDTLNVSDQELSSQHEQIGPAIRAILGANPSVDSAPGFKVVATLAMLKGAYLEFSYPQGNRRVMTEISGIVETMPGEVLVTGLNAEVKHLEYKGETYPCVAHITPLSWPFNKDELEKAYPGWQQRYAVWEGLGLRPGELIPLVFSNQPTTGMSLPGIVFE